MSYTGYSKAPFYSIDCHLTKSKFENVIAYGYILIDGGFRVNITIREHNGKPFPCFPQSKKKDGSYNDLAFPITKESREQIMRAICKALEEI